MSKVNTSDIVCMNLSTFWRPKCSLWKRQMWTLSSQGDVRGARKRRVQWWWGRSSSGRSKRRRKGKITYGNGVHIWVCLDSVVAVTDYVQTSSVPWPCKTANTEKLFCSGSLFQFYIIQIIPGISFFFSEALARNTTSSFVLASFAGVHLW